jgi:hypothetical protein
VPVDDQLPRAIDPSGPTNGRVEFQSRSRAGKQMIDRDGCPIVRFRNEIEDYLTVCCGFSRPGNHHGRLAHQLPTRRLATLGKFGFHLVIGYQIAGIGGIQPDLNLPPKPRIVFRIVLLAVDIVAHEALKQLRIALSARLGGLAKAAFKSSST